MVSTFYILQKSTFTVEASRVDETAVTLELLQQLAVHVMNIQPPDPHQTVVTPCYNQIPGHGVELSAVHKLRVGEHLLRYSVELLHIPYPIPERRK